MSHCKSSNYSLHARLSNVELCALVLLVLCLVTGVDMGICVLMLLVFGLSTMSHINLARVAQTASYTLTSSRLLGRRRRPTFWPSLKSWNGIVALH